ncbi:MAG TPA: DNA-3-methyladenine glycosylase I [Gaiellaceae bacterium]|nr:DNA-3-methyladenine glycosylase I [Gaiellaceae bacterium]
MGAGRRRADRRLLADARRGAGRDGRGALSRDVKRRGFRFVGPTVCYAFVQAAGLVNGHLLGCFRRDVVRA